MSLPGSSMQLNEIQDCLCSTRQFNQVETISINFNQFQSISINFNQFQSISMKFKAVLASPKLVQIDSNDFPFKTILTSNFKPIILLLRLQKNIPKFSPHPLNRGRTLSKYVVEKRWLITRVTVGS